MILKHLRLTIVHRIDFFCWKLLYSECGEMFLLALAKFNVNYSMVWSWFVWFKIPVKGQSNHSIFYIMLESNMNCFWWWPVVLGAGHDQQMTTHLFVFWCVVNWSRSSRASRGHTSKQRWDSVSYWPAWMDSRSSCIFCTRYSSFHACVIA